jgi:hypothetical protein
MMTQEEFMDALAMRRQGNTDVEIADETGYHPAPISKWVQALTEHGVVEPTRVYESPFTAVAPEGPDELFEATEFERIFEAIADLKKTAAWGRFRTWQRRSGGSPGTCSRASCRS